MGPAATSSAAGPGAEQAAVTSAQATAVAANHRRASARQFMSLFICPAPRPCVSRLCGCTGGRQVFGLGAFLIGGFAPPRVAFAVASRADAQCLMTASFPLTAAGQFRIHTGFPLAPAMTASIRGATTIRAERTSPDRQVEEYPLPTRPCHPVFRPPGRQRPMTTRSSACTTGRCSSGGRSPVERPTIDAMSSTP